MLKLSNSGRIRKQTEAFVVAVICAHLGNQEIDRAKVEFKHLTDLELVDSNDGNVDVEIDILVGADQSSLLARLYGGSTTVVQLQAKQFSDGFYQALSDRSTREIQCLV